MDGRGGFGTTPLLVCARACVPHNHGVRARVRSCVAGRFGRQLRVLRPGDVLHRRGERADALYVVLAGAIELYAPPKEASDDTRVLLLLLFLHTPAQWAMMSCRHRAAGRR